MSLLPGDGARYLVPMAGSSPKPSENRLICEEPNNDAPKV